MYLSDIQVVTRVTTTFQKLAWAPRWPGDEVGAEGLFYRAQVEGEWQGPLGPDECAYVTRYDANGWMRHQIVSQVRWGARAD